MIELGTFGAILRFAIEWEAQAAQFYEQNGRGGLAGLFQELGQRSRKRLRRLEQARREGVAEMILEPITGLDGGAYQVALDSAGDEAGLRTQAQALEEVAARFYRDAAGKLPIREVSRLLQSLGTDSEQCRERLAAG